VGAATIVIDDATSPEEALVALAAAPSATVALAPPASLTTAAQVAGWEIGVLVVLLAGGVHPEAIAGVSPERVRRVAAIGAALAPAPVGAGAPADTNDAAAAAVGVPAP
jgi:hypothetical protein